MRKSILFWVCSWWWFTISAQSFLPEVLSASGASFQTAQMQIDWTLGELAIQTVQNPAGQLTQGFHQPDYFLTGTMDIPLPIGVARIFPNPALDWIEINLLPDYYQTIRLKFMDALGNLLWEEKVLPQQVSIRKSISEFPAGSYFLGIIIDGRDFHQVFNIQKIN